MVCRAFQIVKDSAPSRTNSRTAYYEFMGGVTYMVMGFAKSPVLLHSNIAEH